MSSIYLNYLKCGNKNAKQHVKIKHQLHNVKITLDFNQKSLLFIFLYVYVYVHVSVLWCPYIIIQLISYSLYSRIRSLTKKINVYTVPKIDVLTYFSFYRCWWCITFIINQIENTILQDISVEQSLKQVVRWFFFLFFENKHVSRTDVVKIFSKQDLIDFYTQCTHFTSIIIDILISL